MLRLISITLSLIVLAVCLLGRHDMDFLDLRKRITRLSAVGQLRTTCSHPSTCWKWSVASEYAREKRLFVPVEAIPPRLIQAFISAEDKAFYDHFGVDLRALARAVITNLVNYGSGRRPVGASTITQQVTKNFLLTNEVSIDRKIKEAILSLRMERAFTKDQILALYLNEIYLGQGSYGVAAAALKYFDKSLNQLNLQEMAYLAALPKAPNNYHPTRNRRQLWSGVTGC